MHKLKKKYSIIIGLIIGIILKWFALDILYISGDSMKPFLQEGEIILFNKLAYGLIVPFSDKLMISWSEPKVDDIVIYFKNNRTVIKRCVAIPGSPLEFFEDSSYNVVVGERIIPLKESQYQRLKYTQKVPQGFIFAVGDNYVESTDSRTYGFVPISQVLGKALWK